MRNMLAIWREHGIDDAMRTAWERGIVLAGLSAGAMCWFEGGVSMSGGQPEVVHGIGLLPGSLSVHLDGESERLPVYEHAVATGALAPGYAADDGAAVVFRGTRLSECVASRPGARVVRVEADGDGGMHRDRAAGAAAAGRCRRRGSRAGVRVPTGSPSCGRCGPGATAGTDAGGERSGRDLSVMRHARVVGRGRGRQLQPEHGAAVGGVGDRDRRRGAARRPG